MEIKLEYLLDSGNTLRFRNIEIKYFRKMGIWILKYTAEHLTYSFTAVLGTIFVLGVSVLKLVYFLDLLGFKSMHIFVCK